MVIETNEFEMYIEDGQGAIDIGGMEYSVDLMHAYNEAHNFIIMVDKYNYMKGKQDNEL